MAKDDVGVIRDWLIVLFMFHISYDWFLLVGYKGCALSVVLHESVGKLSPA